MPPAKPKIYHITHIRNLPGIIRQGALWSDAKRLAMGFPCQLIGMKDIKRRRLEELTVECHPGTKVGQYVPFYFCPRSIMLYILYRGNHAEIDYREGQEPIIHLQADLQLVIHWANSQGARWAFSDRNAGTRYAQFFNTLPDLARLDWGAMANDDFRDPQVKEGKQAEFLLWDSFPWGLVEYIGVINQVMAQQVQQALVGSAHHPVVGVRNGWYY